MAVSTWPKNGLGLPVLTRGSGRLRGQVKEQGKVCVFQHNLSFCTFSLTMHLHRDVLCGHDMCSRLHKKLSTGYLQTGVGKGEGEEGRRFTFIYFLMVADVI